jgi:transcriptional regulator with GAF, ATPase, and Fis domain
MRDKDALQAARQLADVIYHYDHREVPFPADVQTTHAEKIPQSRIIAALEEERGIVGAAAKRLGLTPRRLYQLLKYHNIQARQFR